MQRLKRRFQILRGKRLNEVIATDTYFASENSIEGYYCAKVLFGMTSKMLHVAIMKTESEFQDLYQTFISQSDIPSAFQCNNTKSEISQRFQQIHIDLQSIVESSRTQWC
jgi:hypothetical protein